MMKMEKSKWRRELTRARGISSDLYDPCLSMGLQKTQELC
jgi:hypothetical protein